MTVGFTGTRKGMSPSQYLRLSQLLSGELAYSGRLREFHHGDCIGADAQAWEIATANAFVTFAHPGPNRALRAFTRSDSILTPKNFITRDHAIVDLVEVMLATSSTYDEQARGSGTWATIRYARKVGRKLFIIRPDGQVIMENTIMAAKQECV